MCLTGGEGAYTVPYYSIVVLCRGGQEAQGALAAVSSVPTGLVARVVRVFCASCARNRRNHTEAHRHTTASQSRLIQSRLSPRPSHGKRPRRCCSPLLVCLSSHGATSLSPPSSARESLALDSLRRAVNTRSAAPGPGGGQQTARSHCSDTSNPVFVAAHHLTHAHAHQRPRPPTPTPTPLWLLDSDCNLWSAVARTPSPAPSTCCTIHRSHRTDCTHSPARARPAALLPCYLVALLPRCLAACPPARLAVSLPRCLIVAQLMLVH